MGDKRALVIGVNSYDIGRKLPELPGASKDALDIAELLETHDDDTPNWVVTPLVEEKGDDGLPQAVGRDRMARAITKHFNLPRFDSDRSPLEATVDLLLYYSGHAVDTGNDVIGLSARDGTGISFAELMVRIEVVNASSVTVILDCCMSGALGNQPLTGRALLPENVTILAAARSREDAKQHPNRGGLFSELLKGGLRGEAADVYGNVRAQDLFAHASGALPEGHQRPTFKSHSVRPVVLRRTAPQGLLEQLAHDVEELKLKSRVESGSPTLAPLRPTPSVKRVLIVDDPDQARALEKGLRFLGVSPDQVQSRALKSFDQRGTGVLRITVNEPGAACTGRLVVTLMPTAKDARVQRAIKELRLPPDSVDIRVLEEFGPYKTGDPRYVLVCPPEFPLRQGPPQDESETD